MKWRISSIVTTPCQLAARHFRFADDKARNCSANSVATFAGYGTFGAKHWVCTPFSDPSQTGPGAIFFSVWLKKASVAARI